MIISKFKERKGRIYSSIRWLRSSNPFIIRRKWQHYVKVSLTLNLTVLIDEVFSSFLILLLNSNISFYEINVLSVGNSIMLERKKEENWRQCIKNKCRKISYPKTISSISFLYNFLGFFFGRKKTFERRKKASNLIWKPLLNLISD